jgi:type II secretory pathway pseudopilin PulG
MVVLAVTGVLFVIIAVTLSGRQNTAEFTRAIQSVQSEIQQTIDQVSAGFYPNAGNFTCTSGGGGVQFAAGSTGQGANKDCVFLGKVIQFQVAGTDPEQYQIYTIAGLHGVSIGASSPFVNTAPKVVGIGGNYTDYSTAKFLQYGLTTLWVHANGSSMGAVGFLMEPGSLAAGSTSGYDSGSQPIDLVPIRSTALSQTMQQAVTGIENSANGSGGLNDPLLTASAPVNPAGGVQICFVSGATRQSGLMTIGSSGRQLLVKLDIRSNRTCS